MEEIKGMSDAEARRWLQKHGYGVGEIDGIMAGEDMCANPGPPPAPVVAAPKPVKKVEAKPVKVAVKTAPKPGM
jgi:hypothetical protein